VKYSAESIDVILLDVALAASTFTWVWAVLAGFDAARLAVIGGTVFLGVVGNVGQMFLNGKKGQ
jgi:hypothetical protein